MDPLARAKLETGRPEVNPHHGEMSEKELQYGAEGNQRRFPSVNPTVKEDLFNPKAMLTYCAMVQ